MISTSTLSDRRGLWVFILGAILVTAGVLMHAPMFWMGGHNHFVLNGMPIGRDMIAGMVAIVGGCGIAVYGLPRDIAGSFAATGM
jgi:MFS transporter, putative metabolite:H+ symporter